MRWSPCTRESSTAEPRLTADPLALLHRPSKAGPPSPPAFTATQLQTNPAGPVPATGRLRLLLRHRLRRLDASNARPAARHRDVDAQGLRCDRARKGRCASQIWQRVGVLDVRGGGQEDRPDVHQLKPNAKVEPRIWLSPRLSENSRRLGGAWGQPPATEKILHFRGRKTHFPNKTQDYYTDFPSSFVP